MSSPHTADAPFDDTDTDIVLRTSDNVDFHVFKTILSLASPVFKDMFTIPQPSSPSNVVHISEDSSIIEKLLLFCYPVANPLIRDLAEAGHLLEAARKYDICAVPTLVQASITSLLNDDNAVSVYGFASQHNWQAKAQAAAFRTLQSITLGRPGVSLSATDLSMMTTADYHRLLVYHDSCAQEAANIGKRDLDWCKTLGCCPPTFCSCMKPRPDMGTGPWAAFYISTLKDEAPDWWNTLFGEIGDELRMMPTDTTVFRSKQTALPMWKVRDRHPTCQNATTTSRMEAFLSSYALSQSRSSTLLAR